MGSHDNRRTAKMRRRRAWRRKKLRLRAKLEAAQSAKAPAKKK